MEIFSNIWIFLILQLINVILSTIKSILLAKGNKWLSVISNSIYYGFYVIIIKAVGNAETFDVFGYTVDGTFAIAIITIITNLIGVWLSFTIMDMFRKDKLWLVKVTMNITDYNLFLYEVEELKKKNMKIRFTSLNTYQQNDYTSLEIYLYDRNETKIVKSVLKKISSAKYCIIQAIKPQL